jgi:uncharacterized protein YyaL (SSP411 family)/aryl-alcohol dehydrogenase-like predicted oxidoreductase
MATEHEGARRKNRLANETSPYLLQHSENPVDWYPWGPEALERARREDRPVLLSIGYAACHWCHVMERESFENEAIAALMNEYFVCVKVDREERPDLDEVYMAATVAMSGHGGWPMTVFLTPDQEPFFAGTYFPPMDQYGRPGFPSLLRRIAELWRSDRSDLQEEARAVVERLRAQAEPSRPADIGADTIAGAAETLERAYEPPHGGFGSAPKFPPAAQIALLLRHYTKTGDRRWLAPAKGTLDGMKNGGMYDHLGGGFARYSTDERWLVPHFEKMLYDNAQLSKVYLEAWQVTGDREYARVARETLDYVVREMQSPEGGYYCATDADSEGEEGKYFVWTPEAVDRELDEDEAEAFSAYYDVTPQGNWEGVSVLNTPRSHDEIARDLGLSEDVLRARIARAKAKLLDARGRRMPPLLDDKIITSWNGLMIGAMAEGSRALCELRYLESANRAADYILGSMKRPDGGLYRTARAGRAHQAAVLEDYAYLVDGLLDLYEAGGRAAALSEARALAELLVRDFADPDGGPFFHTARVHESLVVRTREGHDGALPNANAVAARSLARLGKLLDRTDLTEAATSALRAYGREIERMPRAFCTSLAVVDFLLEPPIELVFAGDRTSPAYGALMAELAPVHLPNRIIAHADADGGIPLARGKTPIDGKPALYVCKDFVCERPLTDPVEVRSRLVQAGAEAQRSRLTRLSRASVPGRATTEGTERYAARHASLGSHAFGKLGDTGLTVSRFGFGGYRVDDRSDEHRSAMTLALTSGVNLIDTSTNYADGHSEQLVGSVLGTLLREGRLGRDEVVVVTKIGYVQGRALETAKSRDRPFPEMVTLGEDLLHCIHPEWLEAQLTDSLARMGLETVDVCLLHNPEYFLTKGTGYGENLEAARTEFYRRLGAAFGHLEAETRRGRVSYYGVSSNTAIEPSADRDATDLSRMIEAARGGAGSGNRFRVLEVPMNLLESGAFLEKSVAGGRSTLEYASAQGIAVLVNRPLNAIVDDRLMRLADPPIFGDAEPMSDATDRLKSLEDEFARSFAPMLRDTDGSRIDAARVLSWAAEHNAVAARIDAFEDWRDQEARIIAPRLSQTFQALDTAFGSSGTPSWPRFRASYLAAFHALALSVARRAAERSRRRSNAITARLKPRLPPSYDEAPLSQRALAVLRSTPGVSSVLVGMRRNAYVEDVVAAASHEPVAEPGAVFRDLQGLELP